MPEKCKLCNGSGFQGPYKCGLISSGQVASGPHQWLGCLSKLIPFVAMYYNHTNPQPTNHNSPNTDIYPQPLHVVTYY